LYPIFEIVPFNAEATERAKADIKKALELLNKHLTYRTYLVGERISLADIVVSMALYRLYTMVPPPHRSLLSCRVVALLHLPPFAMTGRD
jgi:elongation factor 1-gamma